MRFGIEQYISNFVSSQFPQFYQEDGPNFILFVKAYYEWMEQTGNPIKEARSLLEYGDIDSTLDEFLVHFQQKYLYGIPYDVIINKRQLLKHALDVYRSKGSVQCYKLLFRLIYNEDIEIYIPSYDILKPSDGTWQEPKYLEVTLSDNVKNLVGKEIIGLSSKTKAVVESYITEAVNQNIVATLFISNIIPIGSDFLIGEQLVAIEDQSNTTAISAASSIIGSLDKVQVVSSSPNFHVGDIVAVAHRSVLDNSVISYGIGAKLRVTKIRSGNGELDYTILSSINSG